jgi:Fe-S-cluster containining protein
MAYFLLYDSLCNRLKFDDHIPELSDEQKQWLVNTVNEEVNEKGKNVLIAISLLFNQQTNSKYFPTDQQFSIHQLEPYLQWLWFAIYWYFKCGACCYLRLYVDDRVIETGIKCEHLNSNNLCDVYESRPAWCLTAEQMIEKGLIKHLPEQCGYRN